MIPNGCAGWHRPRRCCTGRRWRAASRPCSTRVTSAGRAGRSSRRPETLDPAAWTSLATGQPLALPDHGLGVLHHVHADDVAQAFERALTRPAAIGASFHVVAEQAMTLRGLATGVARWFGREPERDFVDWAEFARSGRAPDDARGAASGRTARSRSPGHLLWVITEFAPEEPCSPVPYRRRPALTSATNVRH